MEKNCQSKAVRQIEITTDQKDYFQGIKGAPDKKELWKPSNSIIQERKNSKWGQGRIIIVILKHDGNYSSNKK